MAHIIPLNYEQAPLASQAVFDEIKALRNVDDVNNFWKYMASHPETLKRTWESLRSVMAPGALDPLVKEMLYVAVSMTNSCEYCIRSHTAQARKKGMTDEMLGELIAVVGMASETNALVTAYQVELDDDLKG
ncbi:MAG: carboxymuconolactone decarboxylase family protein [Acidiferrobacterales bacterium]|nr:carboxymuconolactone decarboxylase family protein [Acidiferrobacterales bacterium]